MYGYIYIYTHTHTTTEICEAVVRRTKESKLCDVSTMSDLKYRANNHIAHKHERNIQQVSTMRSQYSSSFYLGETGTIWAVL